MEFDYVFEVVYNVCPSKGSYGAKIRVGMTSVFLEALRRKAKIKSQAGTAVVKFEYNGVEGLFIAPDIVIVEMGSGKTLEDAKKLLAELVS